MQIDDYGYKSFFYKKKINSHHIFLLLFQGALSAVRYTSEEEKVIRAALGSMLEILDQKPFVTVTVKEILWGYENPLIQLGRDIFEGDQAYPFDEFGLFVGVSTMQFSISDR